MLYRKNLPVWERWLRVILGLALIAYPILTGPSRSTRPPRSTI